MGDQFPSKNNLCGRSVFYEAMLIETWGSSSLALFQAPTGLPLSSQCIEPLWVFFLGFFPNKLFFCDKLQKQLNVLQNYVGNF